MAFSKGNQSVDSVEIKRYIGVAPVRILAVNPNKAELSKLFGREIENEPEYITKKEGESDNIRIDFIVKTDADKCDVDMTTKVAFFIRNEYRYNRDKTKVQVIDEYGRTAWVTVEQAKAHDIPVYSNGNPANITKNYRPCYVGEEQLTAFLKNYLCIPDVQKYVNGAWVMNENTSDSECRLDNIAKYANKDFSELRGIVAMQPENKVKVMFGVRTSDDNKQYQTAYTEMTLRSNSNNYAKLDKDLQERKANGAYPNAEFVAEDIKEYVNTPTALSTPASDNPFGEASAKKPFFS